MFLERLVCVRDFQLYAESRLDKNTLDYYQSGANDENTLRDNVAAFNRYRLRPRYLRGVSSVDMSTTLQGERIDFPVIVGPTSMHCLAHPDGETATVKAAEDLGTCYVMSSGSTSSVEEICTSSPCSLKWFQLYVYRDRELTLSIVRRAEKCGFKALVLTVDAQMWGKILADRRRQFVLPPHLKLSAIEGEEKKEDSTMTIGLSTVSMKNYMEDYYDQTLNWSDVTWLKRNTSLPLILKGILTAEDALLAVKHGVDGVVVSNHGGRMLDSLPASVDVLPEIVQAVGSRCEVYIDGGIRTGIDVLKCLALGARAVLVGRPILWGLAYNGKEGASQVLQILKEELKIAMSITGARNISEITRDLIIHESYYNQPNLKHKL